MKRLFLINILLTFITGCANNPPAPVVNRSPQENNTPTGTSSASQKTAGDDWRPDSYIVKKGDTLYSIGLNHGYDYKEVAAANNISAPFIIEIGQKISFASLKGKDATETEVKTEPTSYENEDGVIISPVDLGGGEATGSSESTSVVTPVLDSPKAIREPYSLEAFNRKAPTAEPSKTTAVATLPTTPEKVEDPIKTTPTSVSESGWSWPTQGNVIARFNEATNKGLDIAGKKGQPINAASPGKVIYAGSDLRGYGKLVIIKHNQTFLSVYAHNSEIIVKEGQAVTTGQKIAAMGDSDTNKVKLHFEIRERGKSVDPEKYLPQN